METHSKYFFADHPTKEIPEDIRPIIITDSFSTPSNVGSIIRLAANIGAKRVIVLNGEHLRKSKIKKTAGASYEQVEVKYTDVPRLSQFIPEDYSLIAIETSEGAISLYKDNLPEKIALVLGNEKFGMSSEVIEQCQQSRYVPMPGKIKSMNVSHAASVCLFEWYRQQI